MSTEHDAFIGRQLGTYQIQSRLGEGGMATVYKAYHPRLRREVAIKVISPEVTERASFQARFEREAQVIASLEHTNIVSIYDFGEESDISYLVMQYVSGGTLREQLRGKRPLEPLRATRYAIQMARALHHAHQHGIVHRDVKPQNMLVSGIDVNHLLLSDFGIAKLYRGGEDSFITEMPTRATDNDSSLTSVDQIIGTADYMSPEQAHGQAVDARTDVYALGVVLYQMLTGEVPFHSDSLRGLLFQQAYTLPLPVRAKNPMVPEILEQITTRAMAKAPAERFQTAEAMAQALELANVNTTDMGDTFLHGTATSHWAPPPMGTGNQTIQVPTTVMPMRPSSISNPQSRQDSFGTLSDARTFTNPINRQSSGVAQPNFGPNTTGSQTPLPINIPARHRVPLSYILVALVVIIGLIVVATRVIPGLTGNATPTTTTTHTSGPAQAFIEDFHNDSRNWQQGSVLGNGVQAQVSNNQYVITTSENYTSFAYPQSVGTLPTSFTLTAKMQETANAPTLFYGLAFHFTEISASSVKCYAFLINNAGDYAIYEYSPGASPSNLFSGTFTPTSGVQTLQVKAQKNNYTFAIDGYAVNTGLNHATTLSNSDIQDGDLALLVTGPGGNFVTTQVALATP
jgi:serine/threonine protein kinase